MLEGPRFTSKGHSPTSATQLLSVCPAVLQGAQCQAELQAAAEARAKLQVGSDGQPQC